MKHVVMFSGGIGSWATAHHVTVEHGSADVTLLFADVGGQHNTPHAGEDEDCYRFIDEAADNLGAELITLNVGKTIWDTFEAHRFLGNTRLAHCSFDLKQKPCREWLLQTCDPASTLVYVGIGWHEIHRLPTIQTKYQPYTALAPLIDPPYLDQHQMLALCRATGVEPPRMYAQGFPHANCGGGCVKAGKTTFIRLLRWKPDRYAYWEAQEQHMRDLLGDVTILRDRSNNDTPMTLRELRERQQTGQRTLFEDDDKGCDSCFTNYGDPA